MVSAEWWNNFNAAESKCMHTLYERTPLHIHTKKNTPTPYTTILLKASRGFVSDSWAFLFIFGFKWLKIEIPGSISCSAATIYIMLCIEKTRSAHCSEKADLRRTPAQSIIQWLRISDFGSPGSGRWSGSSPKLNSLVPGPCPTPPRNFVKIRSRLFQLSDGQTDRQTNRPTWKHNLLRRR